MIRWRCWRWRPGMVGRVDCGSKAYRSVGLLCSFGQRRIYQLLIVFVVRSVLLKLWQMGDSWAGGCDYFCVAHDGDRGISRLVRSRTSGGGLLIVGVYDNSPRHEFLGDGSDDGKVFLSVEKLSMENSTRFFLRLRRNGGWRRRWGD
jgi:hypothetical protein